MGGYITSTLLPRIQSGITSPKAARILFYPTLLWNIFTVAMSRKRRWYDRIDRNVVLGALPLRIISQSLINKENIGGVVTLNEEYETRLLMFSNEKWKSLGIKHLHLPTPDFNNAPDFEKLMEGVQFIKQFDSLNISCYVHCKAGRGRSATLVACYLMELYNITPDEAINILKSKREQTLLGSKQVTAVKEFYEHHIQTSSRPRIPIQE
ncbi:phosphatidylglycerophosphatase and protein-tyrosine phosphatase 1-like [Dendronephthya gigantea]|uniref:phosphatidylglycerophosphatase and protein-tyrosine phosphatase 1-like n=1 Tax=Dendronephthya gigantea TaxID=151771 RepID=UPI00106999DB|nr:phosphatidylglycerophosphatase and protein-tyrosine phosphatase 1-like [Dendronephthya gigantea]XP_028401864.1 phosphatidylglycerophosphatase and protein-tyrosine phosphatase 1-like [Dendronephthya gigantea]